MSPVYSSETLPRPLAACFLHWFSVITTLRFLEGWWFSKYQSYSIVLLNSLYPQNSSIKDTVTGWVSLKHRHKLQGQQNDHWLRVPAAKPAWQPESDSPAPTWWKERMGSCSLSSDFCMYAMAHPPQTHARTQEREGVGGIKSKGSNLNCFRTLGFFNSSMA